MNGALRDWQCYVWRSDQDGFQNRFPATDQYAVDGRKYRTFSASGAVQRRETLLFTRQQTWGRKWIYKPAVEVFLTVIVNIHDVYIKHQLTLAQVNNSCKIIPKLTVEVSQWLWIGRLYSIILAGCTIFSRGLSHIFPLLRNHKHLHVYCRMLQMIPFTRIFTNI